MTVHTCRKGSGARCRCQDGSVHCKLQRSQSWPHPWWRRWCRGCIRIKGISFILNHCLRYYYYLLCSTCLRSWELSWDCGSSSSYPGPGTPHNWEYHSLYLYTHSYCTETSFNGSFEILWLHGIRAGSLKSRKKSLLGPSHAATTPESTKQSFHKGDCENFAELRLQLYWV